MIARVVAMALGGAIVWSAQSVPKPPPTGTIGGRVVGIGERPVAGAVVRIAALGRLVTTDAAGRFAIAAVPAGVFEIAGSKPECPMTMGSLPLRTEVRVGEGEQVTDVVVRVWCGATIEGGVVDDDGDPVVGAVVRAFRPDAVARDRALQTSGTDASGRYRFSALAAGEYVIAASRRTEVDELHYVDAAGIERTGTFADVFYPGSSTRSGAQSVAVTGDDVRRGVDMRITMVSTTRIEGTVETTDGRALDLVEVGLLPPDDAMSVSYDRSVFTRNGRFQFGRVTAATYEILAKAHAASPRVDARSDDSPRDVYWGRARVESDGHQPSTVTLLVERGPTLTGRVVAEGSPPPPDRPIRVEIASANPGSGSQTGSVPGRSESSGRVSWTGLAPGQYVLSMLYNPDYWIKSITLGGRDVSDAPFELRPRQDAMDLLIVAGDRPSVLSGQVLDGAGRPVAAQVTAWTTDSRHWLGARRIRRVQTTADGRYVIRGLAPGEYFLMVFPSGVAAPPMRRPDLARYQGSSSRVVVDEGQITVRDLRLVR